MEGLSSCVLVCCCPGARSGSGSFQKVGSAPPPFTSLTSPAWRLYLFVRGAEARALLPIQVPSVFRKSCFPLCTLCYPSSFIMFYAAFLFLYCYRDERVVSWPVALYLFIYLLLMGNNGLLRGGWTRFPSAMAFPGSTFSILVVLYLCLSVVAGLEGLPYREHEAKTHWLIDIVFTSLVVFLSFVSLSLSPLVISFGWKGWLLRRGSAKVLSAMVSLLAFLYMCLSAVAGVEGLSI